MSVADFESLLKASMGLNVASIGSLAVARAVRERLLACGLDDPQIYWDRIRVSAAELQALIEAVVVPETWFFRDRESLAALARVAHEEWLRPHRDGPLRLLSLPCSTGEEPYSMAMSLLGAGIPVDAFRVDAVDISTRALAQAGRGVYGKNSFRGSELAFRDTYFEATAEGYSVREAVRMPVHFQHGNLFAADFLPGAEIYDVVFCRNVLIYFDRATQDRAIVVLKRLLTATGVLFVAPSETALPASHDLVSTNVPLAFAFRKASGLPQQPKPKAANTDKPPPAERLLAPRATAGKPAATYGPMPFRAPAGREVRLPGPRSTAEKPDAPHAQVRLLAPRSAAGKSDATYDPNADIAEAARLADQGHFVEAAACCDAHVRRYGPSAAAFYLLGLVRDATGSESEAGDYYRKALYLDADHGDAQIHLALLMEKQGDRAAAQVLRSRAQRLEHKSKNRP
jgi:chemotaxis protein methyltransferase WspC